MMFLHKSANLLDRYLLRLEFEVGFSIILKNEKWRKLLLLQLPLTVKLWVQWNLDLRKPDLRKNLDLRKIVGTTDFLVHKLFDLRKIF